MPVKPKTYKGPCSLCHKVVEELKYHYDICEPCHQDFINDSADDLDDYDPECTDDDSDEQDMDEDDPSEPGTVPNALDLQRSDTSVVFEKHYADELRPKKEKLKD